MINFCESDYSWFASYLPVPLQFRSIPIGKPLRLSPVFPTVHTVRETFTSYGAPSF
ncbi:hypothetical protein D920_00278 [Enterococcus faecalis 13-SD-W-01]|nr:hypothetical protein D920_00278 [Enterococcus faecalis 13-SD-W-01]